MDPEGEQEHFVGQAQGVVTAPADGWLILQISDQAAMNLAPLDALDAHDLQGLNAAFTPLTDAQLVHIARLVDLRFLDLSNTSISDEGMRHLRGLTNLETLLLIETMIGDAGLAHLRGLESLRLLNLWMTNVSNAGLIH